MAEAPRNWVKQLKNNSYHGGKSKVEHENEVVITSLGTSVHDWVTANFNELKQDC